MNIKFGVPVMGFESQHPEITVDRDELAERLGLDASSDKPLLVLLVESHMIWASKKRRK